jgi:hypothetical protein
VARLRTSTDRVVLGGERDGERVAADRDVEFADEGLVDHVIGEGVRPGGDLGVSVVPAVGADQIRARLLPESDLEANGPGPPGIRLDLFVAHRDGDLTRSVVTGVPNDVDIAQAFPLHVGPTEDHRVRCGGDDRDHGRPPF